MCIVMCIVRGGKIVSGVILLFCLIIISRSTVQNFAEHYKEELTSQGGSCIGGIRSRMVLLLMTVIF
jgi:hypothetical protein